MIANHNDHNHTVAASQGTVPVLSSVNVSTRSDNPSRSSMPKPRPLNGAGAPAHRPLQCMLLLLQARCMTASAPSHQASVSPVDRSPSIQMSRIAKRSYKRALARQQREGRAWYRGRLLPTPKQSPTQPQRRIPQPRPSAGATATARRVSPTFQLFSWNCGGLSELRLEALLQWLDQHIMGPCVVCLQETHWSITSEFQRGPWSCISSSNGTSQAGVLTMVRMPGLAVGSVQYSEVLPGRLLHTRLCTEPPIDVLNCYQHAWNVTKQTYQNQAQEPAELLLQDRAAIWQQIQTWGASIPRRSQLVVAGDFNTPLKTLHPHVGPGITTHRASQHRDARVFQGILQSLGLVAANTWRRSGDGSATFVNHRNQPVQIDFVLLRQPCCIPDMRPQVLRNAPVVADTGMRHFPISLHIPMPKLPHKASQGPSLTAEKALCALRDPQVCQSFRATVAHRLASPGVQAEDVNKILLQAFPPAQRTGTGDRANKPATNLEEYWRSKHALRRSNQRLQARMFNVSWTSNLGAVQALPSARRNISQLLIAWQAAVKYLRVSRALNKQLRQAKQQRAEEIIAQAHAADRKGLTHVYKVMHRTAPKDPRRSIHLKTLKQGLLGPQQSLQVITDYFSQLYQTSQRQSSQVFILNEPLNIESAEIEEAIASLSQRKALPKGHAPAVLWKTCSADIVPVLSRDFAQRFQPGALKLPTDWNRAFVTLLPKPQKPPNCPANLRPICLLPAISKLLARICAQRVRPLLEAAMRQQPQYAYLEGRQSLDALDKVFSHCSRVRQAVSNLRPTPFAHSAGRRPSLKGGVQLSLDLSKAFDRLPRSRLEEALRRLQVPDNLTQLILYIHYEMLLVFHKDDYVAELHTNSGIRQGCGLAPLMWTAFTLLAMERLEAFLTPDQLTVFADDYHISWEIDSELQFHNCCVQIGRTLDELTTLGMQVSVEKTVVLLHLGGSAAKKAMQGRVFRGRKDTFLEARTKTGPVRIPVRKEHKYLGAIITYGRFERSTVDYRLQQAWQTFHRLHRLLTSKALPTSTRVRLWQACVGSVLLYSLPSIGLDAQTAHKLRTQVTKQLRRVAKSPAHVTHESNQQLQSRLQTPDFPEYLADLTTKRVTQALHTLRHLQPPAVQQYMQQVVTNQRTHCQPRPSQSSHLTELTQVPRFPTTCPHCGITFSSLHAVRTHIGKSHPAESQAKTKTTYAERSHRTVAFMQYARDGQPECSSCGKRFASWRSFMGHFHQKACPVLHGQATPKFSAESAEEPPAQGVFAPGSASLQSSALPAPSAQAASSVPLMQNPAVQAAARARSYSELSRLIRTEVLAGHCPECRYKCATNRYVARHAQQQHSQFRESEAAVRKWAQSRGGVGQPCRWCLETYRQSSQAHQKACPVLWACGHILNIFSNLDSGQTLLRQHGRGSGIGPSTPGTCSVRGTLRSSVSGHHPSLHPDSGTGGHGARREGPPAAREGTAGASGNGREPPAEAGRPGPVNGAPSEMVQAYGEGRRPCGQGQAQGARQVGDSGGEPGQRSPGPSSIPQPASRPGLDHFFQAQRRSKMEQLGAPGPRPGKNGGQGGSGPPQGALPPSPTAGRHNCVSANGSGLYAVPQDLHEAQAPGRRGGRQAVGHCQQPLPGSSGLAREEGQQSRQPHQHPEDHPGALHDERPLRAHLSPGRPGRGHPSLGELGDHGKRVLPLHEMESGEKVSREDTTGASDAGTSERACGDDHQALGVSESCAALPCAAQADKGDELGGGPLLSRNTQSMLGVAAHIFGFRTPRLQFSDAPGGLQPPPLQAGSRPTGEGHRGGGATLVMDEAAIKAMKLGNQHNYCYANATLTAILWLFAQASWAIDPPRASFRQSLQQVLGCRGRMCHLWQLASWKQAVQPWRATGQQDAAEFLQSISPHLIQQSLRVEWEARTAPSAPALPSEVIDAGSFWPLPLSARLCANPGARASSLQDLVEQWTHQVHDGQARTFAAADEPPQCVLLQVARFSDRGDKLDGPILPPFIVNFPYFVGPGNATQRAQYTVHSIIYHLGRSTTSGHYRAALLKRGKILFLTDDGRAAQPVPMQHLHTVYSNSYIFCLTKNA